MKVVHLNTYDGNGGAGRACLRLSRALEEAGLESGIWVSHKFGNNPRIQSLSPGWLRKGFSSFGILLERFVSSFVSKKLKIPFSVPVWGKDISKHPALLSADIIHIHWINHAFLRPRDLAKLRKLNKPIVWTFHDSNAFTGGCHVRYSCDHFERECGNCPLLKNPGPDDYSHKIWQSKNRAYKDLQFSIIAPSNWMMQSIKRSKLLAGREVNVIPNTLETDVFTASGKSAMKQELGLDPGKFVMLSGFMPSRKDLHKGTPYLLEALKILIQEGWLDRDKVELIVFGNRDEKNVPDFPVRTTFLGTISDDQRLARCYSAADVFITPSLEDNLPNTVLESLACGTPVVAFTTGGIPDMVQHKANGYLAEYRSSEDLARGIDWVFRHHNPGELNNNARQSVLAGFSEKVIAARHIALYEKLLSKL